MQSAPSGVPWSKREHSPNRQRNAISRAIEKRGSVAQFARDLGKISGEEVTWARVYNWIERGVVARNMVLNVHLLTGVSIPELLGIRKKTGRPPRVPRKP